MDVTYFYCREFESKPFIEALQRNNIETKAIKTPNRKLGHIKYLIKSVQLAWECDSDSNVIFDSVGLTSSLLHIKNILTNSKNGYNVRLRGDALAEHSGLLKKLVSFNLNGATAMVHVSNYLEQKYKRLYPSKRHYTVYNGITIDTSVQESAEDINKYLKLIQKYKIRILTVMNFEYRDKIKHLKGLIPIINRINHEYSAVFVFIGDGPYQDEIKSIFYGQKGVLFLGRLPRNELIELMQFFDIFYYPSGFDILPNVILEASIAGLPVISSSVGGIPEIVLDKKTGFLMENTEEDSYRYLKLLIEDEALRCKIAMLGREYITKKFDWRIITNDFVKIIKDEIDYENN